jgi:hypothetical protein
VVLAQGKPDDPPGGHIEHAGQVQLALGGDDLGAVAVPLAIELLGGEVPADQVWRRLAPSPRPSCGAPVAFRAGLQALLAQQCRDGVLTDPLPGLAQVSGDPRGAVAALVRGKQPGDLDAQPGPAGVLG